MSEEENNPNAELFWFVIGIFYLIACIVILGSTGNWNYVWAFIGGTAAVFAFIALMRIWIHIGRIARALERAIPQKPAEAAKKSAAAAKPPANRPQVFEIDERSILGK